MKHKNWTEYPIEEIGYGSHEFGFGCYRIDKEYNKIDFWLDWSCCSDEEKIKYNKWLFSNGFEIPEDI